MCSANPSSHPPARIHLLAAKEAPLVVVIRRKPSRLVHVMRLNTENDEIEHGSWFDGRIYAMRCDLSFDGQHMIYLAMGSTGDTWTGICKPPFLRTEVDWVNTGSWHGGGLFRSAKRLELNAGYAQAGALEAIGKLEAPLPFEVGLLANPGYGEDEGVLYPRLERDGFRRAGPLGKETRAEGTQYGWICQDDPGWVVRPTPSHPELRVRYRGYSSGRGRVFEWDLPDYPALLDEQVSWATYDSLGQLIVARRGVVYRYSLGDLKSGTPSAVFDLEMLERPARAPGSRREEPAAPSAPPIETVRGNLPDIEVQALILPASESPWVRQVRELAGGFLAQDLQDWTPESGEVLRTPAYYLRQHDLVHVAEPPPSAGIEALRRACRNAFEALSRGSDTSVALRPIGLEAGWSRAEAMEATMEAARAHVEADPDRRVLIVED